MELPAPRQPETDLTVDDFEHFFVQVNDQNVQVNNQAENEHSLNNQTKYQTAVNNDEKVILNNAEVFELVSMAEASRRLKVPYPTLRRQVLSGKIPSEPGSDGKPLVRLNISENSKTEMNTNEHSMNINEQIEYSPENSPIIQALLGELQREREFSRQLTVKLEAACHRNGFLEAQTQTYQDQIKLLTDSQHKPGWWQTVCNWFGAKHKA